jgi:F-type H+-transporting ATPase subunit gamma
MTLLRLWFLLFAFLFSIKRNFHRLRQSGIDEELFDVVAGFEVMSDANE